MKAEELRLGNYVSVLDDRNERCNRMVTGVYYNMARYTVCTYFTQEKAIESFDINIVEPIPLTEEWLVKFGFEKTDFIWNDKSVSKDIFVITGGLCYYAIAFTGDGIVFFKIGVDKAQTFIREVKYVHQLQNLYFALTGEELEIK